MCQGGLDPKYMLRDIEARMRDFPAAQPEKPNQPSIGDWIMARLQDLRQRVAKHV